VSGIPLENRTERKNTRQSLADGLGTVPLSRSRITAALEESGWDLQGR
jgi:hypothetical protein